MFPIHYPRPLLRAFGLLPVEVWGPPGVDATLGASRLQAYACSIVRDATTAAEYRETARLELSKQIALCKVSLGSGYVFDSADLIAALANESSM